MSEQQQAQPPYPIHRFQPLYRCLGWSLFKREPRYWIAVGDAEPVAYRAGEMLSLNWLVGTIYPDAEHWRRLFGYGRKVDAKAAASWFIRQCHLAGPYTGPTSTPSTDKVSE